MIKHGHDSVSIFVTGVIRAMEAKRVTGEVIGLMAQSASPGAALELLSATYYRDFMAGGGGYEEVLAGRRKWLLDFMDAFFPPEWPGILFRIGFDYHNIKLLLKKTMLGSVNDEALSAEGTIPLETMAASIETGEFAELPACMGEAVRTAGESYDASGNPLVIDLVADRFLYEDLRLRAAEGDCSFIAAHYRALSDLTNIHTFLRAGVVQEDPVARKLLYVPGGAIDAEIFKDLAAGEIRALENLARHYGYERAAGAIREFNENHFAMEREIENTLAEQLEGARFLIRGVEPIFAFGRETEIELTILGVILAGITAGVNAETIARRLPARFRSRS